MVVIWVPAGRSIQEAIDRVWFGDTIRIAPGNYHEHPIVKDKHAISIEAFDWGSVMLEGLVVEDSSCVTIKGLTF